MQKINEPSEVRKRAGQGALPCKIPGACNTSTLARPILSRVIGMWPQIKGTELIRINDLKSGAEI